MKPRLILAVIAPLAFLLASCDNLNNMTLIQQQATGDYKVSVLSDDGTIKEGSDSFTIEFRNMSDSELVKVSDVKCRAQMQMRGNPMIGETSLETSDIPGRFEVKYNFPMKGNWLFTVSFNDKYTVQFTLNVI